MTGRPSRRPRLELPILQMTLGPLINMIQFISNISILIEPTVSNIYGRSIIFLLKMLEH